MINITFWMQFSYITMDLDTWNKVGLQPSVSAKFGDDFHLQHSLENITFINIV